MTTAISTDVWRREAEPIGSRSTTTTQEAAPSSTDRSIFEVLREILPRYDLEAIAEHAEALSLLSTMSQMATDREQRMSSRPDSAEEQAEQTAITEALAPGQLESIAGHDDPPDE
jgi:hypothetical protein